MIGYSQESSKIKVKDNQLKITQITLTQNYSLLNTAHCSTLLIAQSYLVHICSIFLSAHPLNFTQCSILPCVKVKVREYKYVDFSCPKYFTNYIYEWLWEGKTIQSRAHFTVDFQSIGKTYSATSIPYRCYCRYLSSDVFNLIIWIRLTA